MPWKKIPWFDESAGTFTGLSDTPSSYTGVANQFPRVKSTEDGLEWSGYTPLNKAGDTMTGTLTMQANIDIGNKHLRTTNLVLRELFSTMMTIQDTSLSNYRDLRLNKLEFVTLLSNGNSGSLNTLSGAYPVSIALNAWDYSKPGYVKVAEIYGTNGEAWFNIAKGRLTGNLVANEKELLSLALENLSSDPSTSKVGRIWFNTSSDRPKVYTSAGTKGLLLEGEGAGIGAKERRAFWLGVYS